MVCLSCCCQLRLRHLVWNAQTWIAGRSYLWACYCSIGTDTWEGWTLFQSSPRSIAASAQSRREAEMVGGANFGCGHTEICACCSDWGANLASVALATAGTVAWSIRLCQALSLRSCLHYQPCISALPTPREIAVATPIIPLAKFILASSMGGRDIH